MGSHWAGVAMYLNKLSKNSNIKSQKKITVDQYDTLLKRNLRIKENGYIWNSTYDNIRGTFAPKVGVTVIQDVSHGNHVLAYIVAAYEFGNKNWTLQDLKRLSNTFKNFVYDNKKNVFRDNVDGTADKENPGRGSFISDGWVKLAKYDEGVKIIVEKFNKSNTVKKFNQELQFKANLYNVK